MFDRPHRELALDARQSFIVQAPAGSGKTELLTQRFLKLLSIVDKPEEIVAVTFTRKAAAQMRQRITNALKNASTNDSPESEHEKITYVLAKEALKRDQAKGWDIVSYPNRLRVLTIDAVCAYIANRMPILTKMGATPEIVEFPNEYYQEAVHRLLTQTDNEIWASALNLLFEHLDNRIVFISTLFESMLARRDQWLPYLGSLRQDQRSLQSYINQAIHTFIEIHLNNLNNQFDPEIKSEIMVLLDYAQGNLNKEPDSFPAPEPQNLKQWLNIAGLLLTKDNSWRKAFTVKNGFPSPGETKDKAEKALRKERKEAICALVEQLSQNELLLNLLGELSVLPRESMSAQQSEILNAMGILLPVLVAHLQVIFQERGKIDFTEVSIRALNALGDELEPSDISLSLDYQIHHLMIDEYQDTSSIQYRLFEKLVMGWQENDNKTVFLVGDPMQSIYKFRGAEVSLFIKTQQEGLGHLKLTPLYLSQNFRSSPTIIEWVNNAFVNIFPSYDEKSLGGVKYAQAFTNQTHDNASVSFYATLAQEEQAQVIVNIITSCLARNPDEHIAVLVKAKRHLSDLIRLLKQLRINFVAVEIEHLASRPHVMDMITLLRATLNWSDKLAWFALLRAPWVGLTLADLYTIAKSTKDSVWQTLNNLEEVKGLSVSGTERLTKFIPILSFFFEQRQRQTLSAFLRGLWISIGGPQCYEANFVKEDIEHVLTLIHSLCIQQSVFSVEELEQRLSHLFVDVSQNASQEQKTHRIELMTIHKAKGLEFDTVIMPHLEAKTKAQDPALMLWFEHAYEEGIDLILAPRRAFKEEYGELYRFVDAQLRKKSDYEAARLLYVGATRAKKHLYFVASINEDENGFKAPAKGSFLHMLWPYLDVKLEKMDDAGASSEVKMYFKRLCINTKLPILMHNNSSEVDKENPQNIPQMNTLFARTTGIAFHRLMQRTNPQEPVSTKMLSLALRRLGLTQHNLQAGVDIVRKGFENMLSCEKGKWILSDHQQRHSEWALSCKTSKGIENIIIDCSFVDNDNIRWIVDFKLTEQSSFSDEELKEKVEQYRGQLIKYKKVLMQLENRTVRCGLYFPMAKQWYEYE